MKQKYFTKNILLFVLFSCAFSFAQPCNTTVTSISGPAPSCNSVTATLTATHDGDQVYWFNAATNGTLLHTGNPYQTSALSSNTSFWAESRKQVIGSATSGGGKLAPTSTGGSTVVAGTAPWGLMFNATQSFRLNSVDVFLSSTTPGTLTIQLKDNSLNVLQTWTIATPAGGTGANPVQFTVPLNYIIPIGTGYRLVALSPSPSMIRDLASGGFPFPIGSVGSVTQGTISNANTNATTHYFFYNWNYTPIANCVSTRQQITVAVNTTSQPTGAAQQLFTLGETIADLDVIGTGLQWYADAAGTIPLPTSTVLTEGTIYYVSQTLNGCQSTLLAVTAVTVLGVADSVFSRLEYFPNPVKDNFTLSNLERNSIIEIHTILGQQMTAATYDSEEVSLDFSGFTNGIYLVKITSNNETKTIKVIKN